MLFSHLVMPVAFLYFFVTGDNKLKIGMSDNHVHRQICFQTSSFNRFVTRLILTFPVKYKWEVNKWFKDTYDNQRVKQEKDPKRRPNKNSGEFYQWCVLETFLNLPNQVISIQINGTKIWVDVTLTKVMPESKEYGEITSKLNLIYLLKQKPKEKYRTPVGLGPGVFYHVSLSDYPENMREQKRIVNMGIPFDKSSLTENSSAFDFDQEIEKCKNELAKYELRRTELLAKLKHLEETKPPL